jgi:predicted ATPase
MIYLEKIQIPEMGYIPMPPEPIPAWTIIDTQDEYYPLGVFGNPQNIYEIDCEDITIFYGGNGSGKTTLLNLISESFDLFRYKPYLRTEAFDYYVSLFRNTFAKGFRRPPLNSKILASDDIFSHILSVREENTQVKTAKNNTREMYYTYRCKEQYKGVSIDFSNPEDVKEKREYLRNHSDANRKSGRQFVRSRAGEMQRQLSNGENAILFFDKEIDGNALYLLDEPENSMSPKFQLALKELIEDSVQYKNCQFIIATHSPIILALKHAKIYNLDATPVTVEKWQELENIKIFYELFKTYADEFQ